MSKSFLDKQIRVTQNFKKGDLVTNGGVVAILSCDEKDGKADITILHVVDGSNYPNGGHRQNTNMSSYVLYEGKITLEN